MLLWKKTRKDFWFKQVPGNKCAAPETGAETAVLPTVAAILILATLIESLVGYLIRPLIKLPSSRAKRSPPPTVGRGNGVVQPPPGQFNRRRRQGEEGILGGGLLR
jgi:hypothetical protein